MHLQCSGTQIHLQGDFVERGEGRYKWFYFKSHLPPKRFPKYLCHRMAQFWSYNCLVVFLFIFYSQTMVLYIIHLLRTIWFYYFNNHRVLNSILVQCVSIGKCQLGANEWMIIFLMGHCWSGARFSLMLWQIGNVVCQVTKP